MVREAKKTAVREILAAMPERDRAILRAMYLEGKTTEEVAAEQRLTADYVRVMTHRAKARFRNSLLGGAASLLSAARQDEMTAERPAIGQIEANPTTKRFQELVAAKYTRGLTLKERQEMNNLESVMEDSEASFCRPILDRARNSATRSMKKRRSA